MPSHVSVCCEFDLSPAIPHCHHTTCNPHQILQHHPSGWRSSTRHVKVAPRTTGLASSYRTKITSGNNDVHRSEIAPRNKSPPRIKSPPLTKSPPRTKSSPQTHSKSIRVRPVYTRTANGAESTIYQREISTVKVARKTSKERVRTAEEMHTDLPAHSTMTKLRNCCLAACLRQKRPSVTSKMRCSPTVTSSFPAGSFWVKENE